MSWKIVTPEAIRDVIATLQSDAEQNTRLVQRLKTYRGRGEAEAVKLSYRIAGSVRRVRRCLDIMLDTLNDLANPAITETQRKARLHAVYPELEAIADDVRDVAQDHANWLRFARPGQ